MSVKIGFAERMEKSHTDEFVHLNAVETKTGASLFVRELPQVEPSIIVSRVSALSARVATRELEEKKDSIIEPAIDESFYDVDILSDIKAHEMITTSLIIRTILIVGGTGNIGLMLIKKYYKKQVRVKEGICAYRIVVLSRDEYKQSRLKTKYPEIEFIIGDVRDYTSLSNNIKTIMPDVIIIASALRDVHSCEKNIGECLKTNVEGVRNVIDSSFNIYDKKNPHLCNLRAVLLISSDKACSPTTTFGMSKALSERLILEAASRKTTIRFVTVRSPDAINCKGSRFAIYREIATTLPSGSGGGGVLGATPISEYFPISDAKSTNFVVYMEQIIELIHTTIEYGNSGEIFVPNLISVSMSDCAKVYSKQYNKPTRIIGFSQGEKTHEILLNYCEILKSEKRKIGEVFYYVILPGDHRVLSARDEASRVSFQSPSTSIFGGSSVEKEYDSSNFRTLESIGKSILKFV